MIEEMAFGTYYEIITAELREALARYNEMWLQVQCRPETERPLWATRVECRRFTVVVLTSCLLENVINFYLCTKCKAPEFEKVDHYGFVGKWIEGPKRFVPKYDLPKTSNLVKDLKALKERRVASVHPKPMISIDKDNRHQGNEPPVEIDEHSFIERCSALPVDLIEHILHFDPEAFAELSSIRIACGQVQLAFAAGQHAIRRLGDLPEELITEIMEQGITRQTATLYAALIGPVPSIGSDGMVRVRTNGIEIARIKPLKYFKTTLLRVSD